MIVPVLAALLLQLPSPTVARLPVPVPVQVAEVQDDRSRFAGLMMFAQREELGALPLGEIAVAFGDQLRGLPYEAGVLDAPLEETLIAPLDRFDCVLFVESVLALARGAAEGDSTYEGYLRRVEVQRYRGGAMRGYGSRLHYFTEWIADGAARGLVEDVTAALPGSAPYRKALTFMSTNRRAYPRLQSDSLFAEIVRAEARLAARPLHYVPKARVRGAYRALQSGDVIATTTDIPGLDVTHVGFAVVNADGSVGFLHASPGRGVILAPDLAAYLARNAKQTGIVVARPLGRVVGE
jgi:hypothetical protein